MEINRISIIGLGLIGGSIAKALKRSNLNVHISAYDNRDILLTALEKKVIDYAQSDISQSLDSDLIFLCLPIDDSLKTFHELIPHLKEDQIISDVCSVKSVFQGIWEERERKGFYIGGHPMTGKEKGGFENSDPLLFENCVYILNDCAKETTIINSFTIIISKLGARITYLNPKVHDIIVASVSHLPQLVSVSLINSASLKDSGLNFLDFAAGGFRDMTRVAASDFNMWEPIIRSNSKNIIQVIDNFISDLGQIKKSIVREDFKTIANKFEAARIIRDEIPKNTKGFLSSLYDIFIFVKDEPGVISKISTALLQNNINIKDIELLKIREGTGGTFRLSFDSKTEADKAKEIIERIGFSTKE